MEERRARLENDASTKRLRLAMETDKTGEDGSYHTAQVGPGDKRRAKNVLDLIWIEIGVFKNKKIQGMSTLAL